MVIYLIQSDKWNDFLARLVSSDFPFFCGWFVVSDMISLESKVRNFSAYRGHF